MSLTERTTLPCVLEVFTVNKKFPYFYIHFYPTAQSSKGNLGIDAKSVVDLEEYKQRKRWYSMLLALKNQPAQAVSDDLSGVTEK